MQARKYRFPVVVAQSICLMILLQQCAWIFREKELAEIIKPVPVGGYETLAARIHYPQSLREIGVEGKVVVNALISIEGEVKQTRVVEPLNQDLDKIVTNAIKRTRFEPATRQGKPEEVWIAIPFVFALKDWPVKQTPFTNFTMTILPDPAYKNFEVEIIGELKANLILPMRVECLLPFNAANPLIRNGVIKSPASGTVTDDRGEWLIFQISNSELAFGFTYKTMDELLDQKFLYEFVMNHALPEWELHLVYGDQNVRFSQTPARTVLLTDGKTQFEYDFKKQDAYESRFLEIELN